MKYYTGVGSRKTPEAIRKVMSRLACRLESLGWTLRTGDADGADAAFRAADKADVYTAYDAKPNAIKLASQFHPAWNRCSQFARKLHGRNAYQVLGRNLRTPSSFLICWTEDSVTSHKERSIRTGGTGTAISIADHYKIPVFNLCRVDHLRRTLSFLDKEEEPRPDEEKLDEQIEEKPKEEEPRPDEEKLDEQIEEKPKETESITANLLQIKAPHFCAGLELKKRPEFNKCAPIIHYMKAWDWKRIKDYTSDKGWSLVKVA